MTPEELEQRVDTLEVINNELASRLARQSDSLAKIDTKAVFLVGFAATAAQFLAAQNPQPVFATLAFAAYAIAFVSGLMTFRVADYEDLEPKEVLEHNARDPRGKVLAQLAATRVGIFERNRAKLNRKATCWAVSLCAVGVGLVLSTVSLMVHTDGHDRHTERGSGPDSAPTSAPASRPTATKPY